MKCPICKNTCISIGNNREICSENDKLNPSHEFENQIGLFDSLSYKGFLITRSAQKISGHPQAHLSKHPIHFVGDPVEIMNDDSIKEYDYYPTDDEIIKDILSLLN